MKKWIAILSGLLLAQLVLAVAVNLTGDEYGAFESREKLLAFDRQAVNGLRIEDGEQHVRLLLKDGKWQLPEDEGFPADGQRVDGLLDKLAALDKGWPVATTGTAARRFKVADEQFERKLTLLAGDESLVELYVGTSPGFRKVHVRPAGADEIFAVAFNTWEASAKPDDWIDKDILKLDVGKVQRIELPELVLQRDGDAMQVADLAEQEEANTEEIDSLLSKLAGLRIQSLLGHEAKPEYQQDTPVLEIKLMRGEGDPITYRFSKPEDGSDYVLKRSDLDDYFKLPEYTVKPLLEVTREKLVQAKAGSEENEVSETTGDTEDTESEQETGVVAVDEVQDVQATTETAD
jgi:hypothetical protein